MSDGATIRLIGDKTRQAACGLVMRAPEKWIVSVDPPKRTLSQSSKFWAICDDVAKSGATWSGTTHTKQGWHDLFLAGWAIVKHKSVRLLIGLEGELVSLLPHSASLSEAEMSDLLDYTVAWCAMHQVELRE